MAEKISFDLVSPERLLLSDSAEMVELPGIEGDMGVMSGHMPLITTLRPGFVAVSGADKGDSKFFVIGGFAEVTTDKCTVLAEEAYGAAEFDADKLAALLKTAEEDLDLAKSDEARIKAESRLEGLRLIKI